MWTEYTPPSSPSYAESAFRKPRLDKTRSAIMKERSSTYYADLASRTRQAEKLTAGELEHGWAAAASALRAPSQASEKGLPALPLPVHRDNVTLADLVDSDISEKDLIEWEGQSVADPAKNNRWTLFACLGLTRRHKSPIFDVRVAEKRSSAHSPAGMQTYRNARHDFLAKRQARGSIMYDKESGIAQIPLYAAPRAAQVAGAPALSSFAPRAPLGSHAKRASTASWSGQLPVSKASATVDADGNIISVNKRQSYAKDKGRFSTFLSAESQQPLPPLPPLPHQYKP